LRQVDAILAAQSAFQHDPRVWDAMERLGRRARPIDPLWAGMLFARVRRSAASVVSREQKNWPAHLALASALDDLSLVSSRQEATALNLLSVEQWEILHRANPGTAFFSERLADALAKAAHKMSVKDNDALKVEYELEVVSLRSDLAERASSGDTLGATSALADAFSALAATYAKLGNNEDAVNQSARAVKARRAALEIAAKDPFEQAINDGSFLDSYEEELGSLVDYLINRKDYNNAISITEERLRIMTARYKQAFSLTGEEDIEDVKALLTSLRVSAKAQSQK
jgi:tetratricopeptide (TPR) repeat protein